MAFVQNSLNDSEYSDVTIIASDGAEFKCHKVVLASASSVFNRMFQSGFREAAENRVTIEDVTSETLKIFLALLYGKPDEYWAETAMDFGLAQEIFKLNEKYDIDRKCKFRLSEISYFTHQCKRDAKCALQSALMAHSYQYPELEVLAIQNILRRFGHCRTFEEWKEIRECPDLMENILVAATNPNMTLWAAWNKKEVNAEHDWHEGPPPQEEVQDLSSSDSE